MLYKEIEPELFRRAAAGDEEARQELVVNYWDRQFLRKYGLFKIPQGQWGDLDPEPNITFRLGLYDYLLSGLINIAAGDPDPQPNLVGLLIDPRLRLAAAKQLIPRLNKAIDGIGKEIEALEKSLGNR
jgi:hypothetical protein